MIWMDVADLVAQGRAYLGDHAMCHLPGFLRPEAVETVLEEIASIRDTAYWMEVPRRAYSWRNPNDTRMRPSWEEPIRTVTAL